MKIYTSYFANWRRLPETLLRIAISNSQPYGIRYMSCDELIPPWDIVSKYKQDGDSDDYAQEYKARVLDKLVCDEIVAKLQRWAGDRDVVLMCYEKPYAFCHRHLVAEWLIANGYECEEYPNK